MDLVVAKLLDAESSPEVQTFAGRERVCLTDINRTGW